MDLFRITPSDVSVLINQYAEDPEVLRILMRLESALTTGDELEHMESVGALSDLLVFKRGGI